MAIKGMNRFEFDTFIANKKIDDLKESFSVYRKFLNTDKNDLAAITKQLVPAGSPADQCLGAFHEYTDIPLQLPFMSYLSIVSAYLLQKDVVLDVKGAKIKPDIWTIVLAGSGAGKTFAFNRMYKMAVEPLQLKEQFGEVASAAKYVEEMMEKNKSLWFADEFAQTLGQIEQKGSPLAQLKEYMLKTYDGDKLERKTKEKTLRVDAPALTVLALNTPDSFIQTVSEVSLTDGFSQRFCFLFARGDVDRPTENYSWYEEKSILNTLQKAWKKLAEVEIHAEYTFSDEAFEFYDKAFRDQFSGGKNTDKVSFIRRLGYRSWKYALIYHITLGKNNNIIDYEDISWAWRICSLHLFDLGRVLDQYNYSELFKTVEQVGMVRRKLLGEGKKITPREILMRCRRVNSVSQLKQILEIFKEEIESIDYIEAKYKTI